MTLTLELPPVVPEPAPAQIYKFVSFQHPYKNYTFLMLPRVDSVHQPGSKTHTLMLHTKTALAACYIIACNTSGFFALEKDRAVAVRIETEFLDIDRVFYHLEDENMSVRYPICTRFRSWRFPRDGLLDDWRAMDSVSSTWHSISTPSELSMAVIARDKYCRTTKYDRGLDSCHLVPESEVDWVC
jgi:hypothetical protein